MFKPDPKPDPQQKEKMSAYEFRKKYGGTKKLKRTPLKKESKRPWSIQLKKTKAAFQKLRRIESADKQGFCKCVNGEIRHWKKCDGGHWIQGKHLSTCFVKENVNPQSKRANLNMNDPIIQKEYREWMIKTYGEKRVQEIEIRSKISKKYSTFELKIMEQDFNKRFNQIKNEKGL